MIPWHVNFSFQEAIVWLDRIARQTSSAVGFAFTINPFVPCLVTSQARYLAGMLSFLIDKELVCIMVISSS